MIDTFSRIKHWQLIILLLTPFLFLKYVHYLQDYLKLTITLILFLLPMVIGLFWFISIGNFLGKVLNEKDKTIFFNVNIIFVVGFMAFIYTYAFLQSSDTFSTNITIVSTDESNNPLFTGALSPIIFLLGLYQMFAVVYNIFFIADCMSRLNNKKEAVKNLILIWFFPIGIWFIQPKINRIYDSAKERNYKSIDNNQSFGIN